MSGTLNAKTEEELRLKLLRKSIILEASEVTLSTSDRWSLKLGGKKDVTASTRQIAMLLQSGLTIPEVIESLTEEESARLGVVFRSILKRLQEGKRFSAALESFPEIFDQSYIALVDAGETAGKLPEIMTRLADHRERMEDMKRKFLTAMVYPSLVVTVSLAVLVAIIEFVIPVFSEMYANFGAEMPPLTSDVIYFSEKFGENLGFILFISALTFISLSLLYKLSLVRIFCHKLSLAFPLVGGIWQKTDLSRFSRTVGVLQSSGVDLLQSVDIGVRSLGNKYLERKLIGVRGSLEKGKSLRESLSDTKVFPSTLLRMIGAGERTGKLGESLISGAKYYEKTVEAALTAMTSVIEPIIILILGAIVGFLIIVMYLPLFDLIGQIGP